MRELNPRAYIPSLNRYATGYDDLYYHRQMNGEGEWWCYPAGEDEQLDVEIELPTGLKDKNGKEIYEGDIVQESNYKTVVEFSTEDVGSCGCCVDRFWGSGFIVTISDNPEDCEVIGNIHENPELLEQGNAKD